MLAEGTVDDPRSSAMLLGMQLIFEEALEEKVADILGRGYYERGEGDGYRNGYRKGRLKSAEGQVVYSSPQIRGVDQEAITEFRKTLSGRSEALEDLAVEMYARGCSTRDIEAIFRGDDGASLLSRTAVSKLTESLWEEYEAFATRDLSGIKPLYLFLDGIAARLTPGYKREAVLVAWAYTWEGKKVLVNIAPGTKESTDCCREFIEEMRRRGLDEPLVSVTDGAPGLIRAVEECLPKALRQRCLAHKMRNIAAKLPEDIEAEFKQAARAAYQAPSPAMAQALKEDLVSRFEKQAPSAVRCFLEDFDACVAHLKCPPRHRKVIRTTNMLERLFEEERRRSKVAPTLFGERPVLKLMFAAVTRASERWHGIKITDLERKQLKKLQEQQEKEAKEKNEPVVKLGSTRKEILQQK